MGQGTESCGGYDVDYDEYEEGLIRGIWTQRKGGKFTSAECQSIILSLHCVW